MRRLEDVLREVDLWNGASELSSELLNGGYTNHTYMVNVDGNLYALRLNGDQMNHIGLAPAEEVAAISKGHALGIAPRVVCEGDGFLVTEFVSGHIPTAEEMHDPEMIRLIGRTLSIAHGIQGVGRVCSPYDIIERQISGAVAGGVEMPVNLKGYLERMRGIEERRRSDPRNGKAYCHNDAYNINMIFDDGRLVLIDWELSGYGDPFLDLGAIPYTAGFSETEERLILEAYLGRECTGDELADLRDMRFIGLLREAAWALLQISIQKDPVNHSLDFPWFVSHVMGRLDNGELSLW